jgi:hypothetical protein
VDQIQNYEEHRNESEKNRRFRIFILNMKRPRTNKDLIQLTDLPEMPNQDERRSIRIERSILSKTKNTNTSNLLLNDAS